MSYLSIIASSKRRFDADAASYFSRIVAAGSSISESNKVAFNKFVKGCKADGIWNAIKACCILSGADTLAGALVPLVGPAPTNAGGLFVAGDYSRTTGLKGNRTSKYLNANYIPPVALRNNNSFGVWQTENTVIDSPALGALIGNGGSSGAGASNIVRIGGTAPNPIGARNMTSTFSGGYGSDPPPLGFVGTARSSSANYTLRIGGTDYSITQASNDPTNESFLVFARNNGSNVAEGFANSRMTFYWIGENLNLTALNNRLATLMSSLT